MLLSGPSQATANWLSHGVGKNVTSTIVGFGEGASFGLAAQAANAISPGAMCTVDTSNGWYYGGVGGGIVAQGVATGGGSFAARGAYASKLGLRAFVKRLAEVSGDDVGAVGRGAGELKFAQKFGLNVNSLVVQNREMTVADFVAKYKKGSIWEKLPSNLENQTVAEALRSGGSTVRKVLTDNRFDKGAR